MTQSRVKPWMIVLGLILSFMLISWTLDRVSTPLGRKEIHLNLSEGSSLTLRVDPEDPTWMEGDILHIEHDGVEYGLSTFTKAQVDHLKRLFPFKEVSVQDTTGYAYEADYDLLGLLAQGPFIHPELERYEERDVKNVGYTLLYPYEDVYLALMNLEGHEANRFDFLFLDQTLGGRS